MNAFITRLLNDRRGNMLAITAAALPLVIGSAGLATDTVQWSTWNRQLQRAADSAAFAGVYARAQSAQVAQAVNTDLAKNNHTPPTLMPGYPQIAYPTSPSYNNAVRVTLAVRRKLPFSSLFLDRVPVIQVRGTAAMIDTGEYCLVALESSTSSGITIGGSSSANLGCGAIANSVSPDQSVFTNGASYNFNASVIAAAGGLPGSINGTTTLKPFHIPLPDPFAGQYPTDIPAGTTCRNFNQNSYGPGGTRLRAGCYNSFNISGNSTYTLDPGVYYLNNTDLRTNGTITLSGTGVTFVFTGTNPGSLQTNGNATIQLTAPTSGTYEKMLFIQAPNATVDNLNIVTGSASSKYDGAMYFPRGLVSFTGSSGASTKCAMLVAKKADFSGNANLQNDLAGCVANKTVKGKMVRLVG